MTQEDQNEVRAIVREEMGPLRQEVGSLKAELIETMRDMQTEIIRGLERFSRGNFFSPR